MNIIGFSIRNPLLVNLGLVLVMLLGVLAWYAMPQEVFPVVQLDMVRIATEFEGASPAEVEQQITVVLEEEFADAQDIDFISSISGEGYSSIFIQLKAGSNVDDFMADARTLLDRIDTLPEIAEPPELNRIRARFPVATLTLYGEAPQADLSEQAEHLREQIMQIPGVASVGVAGERDWELRVVVDPHELAAMKISLQQVMLALRDNLRDQPGGKITSAEGDIRLRGKGVAPDPEQIEAIVLLSNANGGQLRLGDIASIMRQFEEEKTHARFSGQPSINLTITKTADASTIAVAEQSWRLAQQIEKHLPPTIRIAMHTDTSVYLKTRLNVVKSSGLVGLILVLAALYVLLNFRVALVTALGIPVSFLIAVVLMYGFSYSINMVSLFAFLIVLGMIVDDAIIVTENIYRHIEAGQGFARAAELGAKEVFWPVVVSTLTTIAAFMPMLSIEGIWGEFMEVIPFVVCAALLGSLIEAFAVLPSHAAHCLRLQPGKQRRLIHWPAVLSHYQGVLRWSVQNRLTVAALSLALLIITVSYALTRLPYEQFGDVETGQFFINIETPNTYRLEDSLALTGQLEEITQAVITPEELKSLIVNVGLSFIDFNRFKAGSNLIQLVVDLEEPAPQGVIEKWVSPLVSLDFSAHGTRLRSTDEIIDAIRGRFAHISGIERFSILKLQAGPAGPDISVGLASDDAALLAARVDEISTYLAAVDGVQDVQHDQEPGKVEYKYELNDRGRQLGISQSQLASAVRTGFLGSEVVHVTWKEKRLPVRVIYPDYIRQQSSSLHQLPIVLADGRMVYLADVADISISRGLNQIRRRDNQRMVRINAEVDTAVITPLAVTRLIEEKFSPKQDDAGYSLRFMGQKKDMEDSFAGMYEALTISLILIFFLLTALFKSLLDPFVIMLTIPFGFIGVVAGHALFDYNIQFLSFIGMLALSGIIVNDSLILIDFVKQSRMRGRDRISAVIDAGVVRARPILLTTVTTFLGVSPLIFFSSGQTKFLAPMAISLGFGLVFATAVILLTLPCLYLLADDVKQSLGQWLRHRSKIKLARLINEI